MNLCDHYTWLQISNTKNFAFHDIDRLFKLLLKLINFVNQKSFLLCLIDKKFKNIVIREMFFWNNVKKNKRDDIVTLRVEISTIKFFNFVFFAKSDLFVAINVKSKTSLLCHQIFLHLIKWINHLSNELFDIIHNRFFCRRFMHICWWFWKFWTCCWSIQNLSCF